jgi:hypothetical protein
VTFRTMSTRSSRVLQSLGYAQLLAATVVPFVPGWYAGVRPDGVVRVVLVVVDACSLMIALLHSLPCTPKAHFHDAYIVFARRLSYRQMLGAHHEFMVNGLLTAAIGILQPEFRFNGFFSAFLFVCALIGTASNGIALAYSAYLGGRIEVTPLMSSHDMHLPFRMHLVREVETRVGFVDILGRSYRR